MQNLLIFSHTYFQNSKVNRALLELAKTAPNTEIRNLNELYLDGKIKANDEISALEKAKRIIFQFPLFWFSTPSLMKEWQDEVLSKILYGNNPRLLEGKEFSIITTIGGTKESYDGHHGYEMKSLLSPLEAAFGYCGCKILEPLCIFSANEQNLPKAEYLAKFN